MTARSTWATDAAIERLRGLWADGVPASQIARRLGTTKSALLGKVHRLGLPARRAPNQLSGVRCQSSDSKTPGRPAVLTTDNRQPTTDVEARVAAFVRLTPDLRPLTPVALPPAAHCRWPLGERPYRFCCAPRAGGLSYCAAHARAAYYRRGERAEHAREDKQ